MKTVWRKIPESLRGLVLMAGLILLIIGIPMSYFKIKRVIRKMQWESEKEEKRPFMEQSFAPFKAQATLIYNNLQTLSTQLAPQNIVNSLGKLDSSTLSIYQSLSQLNEGGISPFQDSTNTPTLHVYNNAYLSFHEDAAQAHFIDTREEYCANQLFKRIANGDWDGLAYSQLAENEDIEVCMKQVANSQYLVVWNEIYHKPAVSSAVSFRTGHLFGRVDVYDITQLKIVNHFYVLAKNSISVSSYTFDKEADKEAEMEKAFRRNLRNNTKSVIATNFAAPTMN